MSLKAIHYNVEELGKIVKGSKKRFKWVFSLDGKTHTIELEFSFYSGKRKLFLNQRKMHEGLNQLTTSFQYPFTLEGSSLNIIQQGETFELRINNKVFSHLYTKERSKNEFVWEDDSKKNELDEDNDNYWNQKEKKDKFDDFNSFDNNNKGSQQKITVSMEGLKQVKKNNYNSDFTNYNFGSQQSTSPIKSQPKSKTDFDDFNQFDSKLNKQKNNNDNNDFGNFTDFGNPKESKATNDFANFENNGDFASKTDKNVQALAQEVNLLDIDDEQPPQQSTTQNKQQDFDDLLNQNDSQQNQQQQQQKQQNQDQQKQQPIDIMNLYQQQQPQQQQFNNNNMNYQQQQQQFYNQNMQQNMNQQQQQQQYQQNNQQQQAQNPFDLF